MGIKIIPKILCTPFPVVGFETAGWGREGNREEWFAQKIRRNSGWSRQCQRFGRGLVSCGDATYWGKKFSGLGKNGLNRNETEKEAAHSHDNFFFVWMHRVQTNLATTMTTRKRCGPVRSSSPSTQGARNRRKATGTILKEWGEEVGRGGEGRQGVLE